MISCFLVKNGNRTEGPISVPSDLHNFRGSKEGATHVPSRSDQYSSFIENREGAMTVPSPRECFTRFGERTVGAFFVPPTGTRFSGYREAQGSALHVPSNVAQFSSLNERTDGAYTVPSNGEQLTSVRGLGANYVPSCSESLFSQNERYGGLSLENPVIERKQVRINEEPSVFFPHSSPQSSPMCRVMSCLT